jgi:polyferredoxin
MLGMTAHLISWYILGIHAVGSIGIEALFSGLSRGVLNAGFIFWTLVFISALLLGRAFCGWFCWFGGYLQLVEWGIDKLKVKVPRREILYLGAIPFVALALKINGALITNWLQDFPTTLTFRLSDVEPWGGQQTGISILITAVLYGPILFIILDRRAWCRYLCPLGALTKIFGSVGIGKVRLVNDKCIGCGKCSLVCDMKVDVMHELRTHGEVKNSNCIRCLECTDECPEDSISFSLRNKGLSLSSNAIVRAGKTSLKYRNRSFFDVTIIVLWISISVTTNLAGFSQDAPQEVKILMSAGLLLVIYGLVWMVKKLWTRI